MKIQKIQWRNFASYGNKLHEIDFSNNENGMFYLLLGSNGAGKSTIAEIIKFAIYGKVGGSKSAKDLPNRFNGGLYTRIDLKSRSGAEITIERGIAPTKLSLTVNGVLYDQAGKKNVDDYIENEVIGIPFYVFNNIISLSINDFKSFLTMTPADKKKIIDKIFGLDIINAAKKLVKEELKEIKNAIELHESECRSIDRSIDNACEELEALKARIQERDTSKMEELTSLVEKYESAVKEIDEKLSSIDDKLPKVIEKESDLREKIVEIKSKIAQDEEKKKLYDNKCCPMCGSDLTTDFHQNVLNDILTDITSSKETANELIENAKKVTELKNKLSASRDKALHSRSEASTLLKSTKFELNKLNESNTSFDTEPLENIIAANKKNKEEAEAAKVKSNKQLNFFKIIEEIFSDSGIKKSAVAQIVPGLNQELAKTLDKLNVPFTVKFDSEFDATIKQLMYEVKPQQLSTGEKKKIDFAILIAIIKLMKMKFPGLNIIFLDELFSSIDSDGIIQILEVVRAYVKELNINTFVVNHSPLPVELFDYKVSVSKANNYSHMEIEKL